MKLTIWANSFFVFNEFVNSLHINRIDTFCYLVSKFKFGPICGSSTLFYISCSSNSSSLVHITARYRFLIHLGAFEYHRSPLVGELFSTCISKTMPNPENTGIKMLNLRFSSLILVYSTVFLEAVLFMQITNMLCFSTNGLHLDVS